MYMLSKDINLPEILHRTMASEAEALREARAKIISAEGELNASQALKEASDVMAKNKITLQVSIRHIFKVTNVYRTLPQLRHLQILTSICHERKLTIVYPFPMDILTGFAQTTANSPADTKLPKKEEVAMEVPQQKESIVSIITNVLEPFMRNQTDIREGESFQGTQDANVSIYKDFIESTTALAKSQSKYENPDSDDLPETSSLNPRGKHCNEISFLVLLVELT